MLSQLAIEIIEKGVVLSCSPVRPILVIIHLQCLLLSLDLWLMCACNGAATFGHINGGRV
jgi:hypothetical protein